MEQTTNSVQERYRRSAAQVRKPDPVRRPFFWLAAFYFVYCARPEDWIVGLDRIPLAKITAICALIGIMTTAGRTKRTWRDMPIEFKYLTAIIGVFFVSGFLSPIWRGGAVSHAIDFAKVLAVFALTFLLITDYAKLRRIIFIQAAAVPLICAVSILKGSSRPRLAGVIGGIYSNPNDLAFAIVLTLPFCVAFLLTAKGMVRRVIWVVCMLIMGLALVMTASRAGLITLLISGTVALWHFGVRGRRFALILATLFIAVLLLAVAGGPLIRRMEALTGRGDSREENRAYESYEQRRFLMIRALQGIEQYPLFGVGSHNFAEYSGVWHDVHMSYLQITVEGGIPCGILYLLFFRRGFKNLKQLRRIKDLDVHTTLFVGGLHASLVGFVTGALFAPEAYQFFPYFGVAYTSALVAMVAEQRRVTAPVENKRLPLDRFKERYADSRNSNALAPVR